MKPKVCDFIGGNGPCKAPATLQGQYIHPKGKKFYRCGQHTGHLDFTHRWNGGKWVAR